MEVLKRVNYLKQEVREISW